MKPAQCSDFTVIDPLVLCELGDGTGESPCVKHSDLSFL